MNQRLCVFVVCVSMSACASVCLCTYLYLCVLACMFVCVCVREIVTVASRGFNLSNSCKINFKIPRLILDMMYFTAVSKSESRGVCNITVSVSIF